MYQPQPYVLLIDGDQEDLEMFSSGLELKGVKVKAFDSRSKALRHLALRFGNMDNDYARLQHSQKKWTPGIRKSKAIRAPDTSLLSCIQPACPKFLEPNC